MNSPTFSPSAPDSVDSRLKMAEGIEKEKLLQKIEKGDWSGILNLTPSKKLISARKRLPDYQEIVKNGLSALLLNEGGTIECVVLFMEMLGQGIDFRDEIKRAYCIWVERFLDAREKEFTIRETDVYIGNREMEQALEYIRRQAECRERAGEIRRTFPKMKLPDFIGEFLRRNSRCLEGFRGKIEKLLGDNKTVSLRIP